MKSSYQLQIGRRGVITFPKELRDQKNITDGQVFTLIDLSDDIFILSRQRSRFDAIADQLAKEWKDSGESLESMLSSLKEVRAEYHEKKYWLFLNTSVIFAAVISKKGGARKIF